MILCLNGEYLPAEKIHISPNDRGFLLADGIYEVVRFYGGIPFCPEEHRTRLENGARVFLNTFWADTLCFTGLSLVNGAVMRDDLLRLSNG